MASALTHASLTTDVGASLTSSNLAHANHSSVDVITAHSQPNLEKPFEGAVRAQMQSYVARRTTISQTN